VIRSYSTAEVAADNSRTACSTEQLDTTVWGRVEAGRTVDRRAEGIEEDRAVDTGYRVLVGMVKGIELVDKAVDTVDSRAATEVCTDMA